ncbi:winged helix-turn-helix transcriptional regulator [Hansschlegelia zhihuaiae]|uniref:Transcriptional regulator n=1 Tax=Hansschlegelia zhihuaiae TaxID=405005 RepID=A0A4Q0MK68_9HYPH|nr:helix-turn-helix domain-containing protein [Hansschlegelia zhihuaiae]RXF74147.1 transcriptional regulator [Hansschlegelia zhihuaiae]
MLEIAKGCPLDRTLRLLSGEWTVHLLWALSSNGPTRHGELRRLVEGISSKVLTQKLRALEASGIVFRSYEATVPPKVTYGLTEQGQKVDRVLRSIEELAVEWQPAASS